MTSNKQFVGYIGTYTKEGSKGIYKFTLDTETKKMSQVDLVATLDNPTYVTISQDNHYLYSVVKDGDLGGAAVYSINGETHTLELINKQLSEGASPCHISVKADKSQVVTANYHKGTVELYECKENGELNPASSIAKHEGSGPNAERQEKPHAHFAGFTPDEKFIVAIDLGIDQLVTYEVKEGKLSKVQALKVKPGSGPRHLAFHPNGKFAYIMTELSSEVIVLKFNSEDGSFTDVQYISTIPDEFTDNNQGSAIHLSADGRFVYAANRGHNSIAIFSVNQETGELTSVDRTSTEGNWPRDFRIDPTGAFLVASNEESGNLVLFARNEQNGTLEFLQSDVRVPKPVCVAFLHTV
ncbi:lactonase family protein [Pullulanibacillus sp. KACC 23026]|uniref:lactonase family protein n=1 Tax=Pullulanibacillus sp. KACC 23026 TaxID=3028315 RepID=UPI0023B19D27|nr:lactonase family protein [Pullulanibacillus sp. KACC 23026]WEG14626.1 lactonase family protein [Pullulanibacillus sp. KACC 23026]